MDSLHKLEATLDKESEELDEMNAVADKLLAIPAGSMTNDDKIQLKRLIWKSLSKGYF